MTDILTRPVSAAAAETTGQYRRANVLRSDRTKVVGWFVATRLVFLLPLTMGGTVGLWDSQWYLYAAEHGYPTRIDYHRATAAFFPLFPLLEHGLGYVLGNDLTAGVWISLLAGLAICLGIYEMAGYRAAVFAAIVPGAAFMLLPYADSTAIALCVWTLVLVDKRRYGPASLAAALATAASPLSLALCGALVVTTVKDRRAWKVLAASPIGILAYFTFLQVHAGSFLGWFTAERLGWYQHVDLLSWWSRLTGLGMNIDTRTSMAISIFCLPVILALGIGMWRYRARLEWWIFCILIVGTVAASRNSFFTARILLWLFPLPIIASKVEDKTVSRLLVASTAFAVLFAFSYMAGRPELYQP
jgi:hypothetical protein